MGRVPHGSASTTEAVAKWKKRETVADCPIAPKEPRSTVPSVEDEARRSLWKGRYRMSGKAHGLAPFSRQQQG